VKYLKLYENHNSFYEKISKQQDFEFRNSKSRLDISELEKQKIQKCLDDYLWDYCKNFNGPTPWEIEKPLGNQEEIKKYGFKNYLTLIPFRDSINRIVNISHWEDDWYLAQLVFNIGRNPYSYYYKCDQIDGLISFIKNLNIGNI